MSYFTEVFEETMDLLEFKHDIEASYSVRNAADKVSGDHKLGKIAQTASKIYNSGTDKSHDDKVGSRDYVKSKNDATNVKKYGDLISSNKDVRKSVVSGFRYEMGKDSKDAKIINKAANSRSNKGVTDRNLDKTLGIKKESYDPTYEYLCRIGAID